MYGSKRVLVRELNPHILCALCGGYLIQATTVIECLHSFCRTCIVKFLETSKVCPICDAQIHKTRPLLNIRPDQTLQSLVYKLVPGLFQDEMRRRREFHATLPESDLEDLTLEERGEAKLEKEFKQEDDHVSLILQLAFRKEGRKSFKVKDTRYLLCPSEVTIRHLKRFIKAKFQLGEHFKLEMFRGGEELTDEMMLQDVALIYSWRGDKPMCICYTVTEETRPQKALVTTMSIKAEMTTQELTTPRTCGKTSAVKLDLDAPDLLSETLTACHLSSPTSCSLASDSSSETCLSILSSTQESYEDSFATTPLKTSFTMANKTTSVAAKTITAPTSVAAITITAPTTVATKNKTDPTTVATKNKTDPTSVAAKTITATTSVATKTIKAPTSVAAKTITAPTSVAAKTITATTSVAAKTITATTSVAAKTITALTSAASKTTTAALSTVSSSTIKPQPSPMASGLKNLGSVPSFPTPGTHKDVLNANKSTIAENQDKSLDLGESTIKFTQHSVQSILSSSKKKGHQSVDLPLSWKPVTYPGVESVNSPPPVKTEDILTLLSSSMKTCTFKQQAEQKNTQIHADKLGSSRAPAHEKAVTHEKYKLNRQEKVDSCKKLKGKSSVNQVPSVNQGGYLNKSKSTEKINSPNKTNAIDREASVKNSSKLLSSTGITVLNSCETNDLTMPARNLNPLVKTNTTHSVLTTSSDMSPKVSVKMTHPLEDDNSIFASYIPKFQRHRKLSSVKRSLSCEGQSPSSTPSGIEHSKSPGCGDSMEKRNWKKRKLSTMDFESPGSSPLQHDDPGVNRQTLSDSSKPASSNQETVSTHNDPYAFTADACTLSEFIPVRKSVPDTAKGSGIRLNQTSVSSSVFAPSSDHSHMASPQNGLMTRGPKLEISANGKVSGNVSDSSLFNTKAISKGKLGQEIATNTLTVSKDRSRLPLTSPAKAPRHTKKNCKIQADEKVAKSRHSNPVRSLSEISVDISSSPSDASSVTSPATDVTSPGTEDRTDSSALPDMAAPCDNDCVSNYQSSRGVPLDLSSKRKK